MSGDALAALRAAIRVHERPALAPRLLAAGLGAYRGYTELLAALERLATRGARVVQIGRSVRGEPLFALHLGSERPDARTAVVLAAVHPIEWIGVEVALALLERLQPFAWYNPPGIEQVIAPLAAALEPYVRGAEP